MNRDVRGRKGQDTPGEPGTRPDAPNPPGRARVPLAGIPAARDRLAPPSTAEGFDRIGILTPKA